MRLYFQPKGLGVEVLEPVQELKRCHGAYRVGINHPEWLYGPDRVTSKVVATEERVMNLERYRESLNEKEARIGILNIELGLLVQLPDTANHQCFTGYTGLSVPFVIQAANPCDDIFG